MLERRSNMKMILVNFIGWRVGSSMLTGLIGKAGADIGKCDVKPTPYNKMGHNENIALREFQRKHFLPHWFWKDKRLEPEEMFKISSESKDEFADICKDEFGDSNTAVTKCMTGSLIASADKAGMDVRVIWLRRNLENQARSLSKVIEQKDYVNPATVKWLSECEAWMMEFFLYRGLPITDVRFEELLARPKKECNRLSEFLDMEIPDEAILAWIKPELSRSTNSL